MVSAFYPVALRSQCEWELVEYMPKKTSAIMESLLDQIAVPAGTLGGFRLQMCSSESQAYSGDDPSFRKEKYPLVIFSPGGHSSRFYHSIQAQTLASHGYTVVTIDHPYDAAVVEYPNGKIVEGTVDIDPEGDPQGYARLLQVRATDVSFVLNVINNAEVVEQLLPLACPYTGVDTTNVPMYGHSTGGGAAAIAVSQDPRIGGGLNLDGSIKGTILETNLYNPYMMWASDWKSYNDPDIVGPLLDWAQLWPHLHWGLQLKLEDSHHATFEDIPYLAHLLGLEPLPQAATELLGSIPADRAMEIVTSYVAAFIDFIVTGKNQVLLEQPNDDFPEVKFVRGI